MQRHNSLTSLHSLLSSRSNTTDYVRDQSTGALLDEQKFVKKLRKTPASSAKSAYILPNGETFTPRTAPIKRNKPARMASYPNRPLKKLSSLVLVHSVHLVPGHSYNYAHSQHPLPQLKHSHSFSNLKEKSKQTLIDSIRSNRLDTPTNIVLPATISPALPTRHTNSLTNNKYSENSSNIIRNEQLSASFDGTGHLRLSSLDSNPSSILNYNRSGLNTPQTSISGSEIASDMLRLEGSTESVTSYSNAKETCSLESIKESCASDSPPAEVLLESHATFRTEAHSGNTEKELNTDGRDSTENEADARGSTDGSANTQTTPLRSTPLTTARSLARTGKHGSGSLSSSASSYRSFSEVDDSDNIPNKKKSSDGDSLNLSERQGQDEQAESNSSDSKRDGDEESIGSSNDKKRNDASIESDLESDVVSEAVSENESLGSRRGSPVPRSAPANGEVYAPHQALLNRRQFARDLPELTLPEPTIMLETPAGDSYLKVGSRGAADRNDAIQEAETVANLRRLSLNSISPPQTPIAGRPGRSASIPQSSQPPTPIAKNSVPPTPIAKNSAPPTPIPKTTAPPTPISRSSPPSTPIEVISDRESFQNNSLSDVGSATRVNRFLESQTSNVSKSNNSETPKSLASFSPGDSQISLRKVSREPQKAKAPYRSMLFSDSEPKDSKISLQKSTGNAQLFLQESALPQSLPEAPSPVSKDSSYVKKIDPIITSALEEEEDLSTSLHDGSSETRSDEILIGIDESVKFDSHSYYSPVQIDKFFHDEQEEVPPRGDLHVNNGFIKLHKRNNSSIGSAQSMQAKTSPVVHHLPEMPAKNLPTVPKLSPVKKPFTPTAARYSMLAVVDVDYDKSLPGTPHKDKRLSKLHQEFTDALNFDIESVPQSLTETVPSPPPGSPEKKSMLKKFSRFLSSGTKEKVPLPRRLNSKTLNSSLNALSLKLDESNSINLKDVDTSFLERIKNLSAFDAMKMRKKGLFLNLKLGSSLRVDELPSPVYSVRERQSQGDISRETTPSQSTKFDLPNYEVEKDVFNDVLMRFDEVEKEVENDIIRLKKTNSIHDFFAKDDELTNDQIVDQKRKDNHQSDESLLSKFSSANSSYESVSVADSKALPHDSYSGITDDIIAEMKREEAASEFPPKDSEKTVNVSRQQLQAAYHEPKGGRKSYLHLAKQFADFLEVEIKLKGFEPFAKSKPEAEERRLNSLISAQQSILKKDVPFNSAPRLVKFSNSISISETYAPYMYKRNNKAVTQYYVKDLNEISKIKNELNAFKCYEMLVHEKSQTNTQFFY